MWEWVCPALCGKPSILWQIPFSLKINSLKGYRKLFIYIYNFLKLQLRKKKKTLPGWLPV
jgi:hypothetical protein